MPYTPIALKPVDFTFRKLAYCILSFAAGLDGAVALVDELRAKEPKSSDWIAVVPGDDPNGPTHIVSETGYGYHAAGSSVGNAPEETTYRCKGTTIHLTGDLSSEESTTQSSAEFYTQDVVVAMGNRSFNTILMSVRHCVLLSCEANNIKRTAAIALLNVRSDDDSTFLRTVQIDRSTKK